MLAHYIIHHDVYCVSILILCLLRIAALATVFLSATTTSLIKAVIILIKIYKQQNWKFGIHSFLYCSAHVTHRLFGQNLSTYSKKINTKIGQGGMGETSQ